MEDAVFSWNSLLENSHRLRKNLHNFSKRRTLRRDLHDFSKRRTSFLIQRASFLIQRAPFLIQLILLACLAALLVACMTIDKLNGFHILGLEAWRWWGLIFAVVGGGLAVALLMDVLLFYLEIWNSVLRKIIKGRNPKINNTEKKDPEIKEPKNIEKRDPEQLKNTEEIDLERGRPVQARSNLHKDADCDDQHQQTPSSKSEEGLGDSKCLKFKEELLEFGEKVEQVLDVSKISLGFVIWVACVLSTWILLFRNGVRLPEQRSKIMNRVTAALAGVLLCAVVWTGKTMWLQVLAFSFIVERSRERIRKAQEDQMVLHTISSRVRHDFTKKKRLDESGSGHLGSNTNGSTEENVLVLPVELAQISHKRQWTPKSTIHKISGITLPLLAQDDDDIGNLERAARVTAGWLFEQILEVYGDDNGMEDRQERSTSKCVIISKEFEELAQQKLEEVTPNVRSFQFRSSERKIELIRRIPKIRRSELEEWLAKVYVDRLVLLRTINGRDDVVCDLNRILSIMVIFFNIVMFLFIMDLLTTTVAISIAAQIVALNFMFGDSAKTTFKAFFFVFESRPFDVGDRCKIKDKDDKNEYEVVVHDMDLLTTIFTKADGDKIYYPNSVLIDKTIENFYPVPDTADVIEFFVKAQKDPERFCQVFTENIKRYLENNSKYWYSESSDISVVIEEVANRKETPLVVLRVKHQVDYYSRGEWARYRDQLLWEVEKILRDNGYKTE